MCNAALFDLIVALLVAGGALAVMLALYGYPPARQPQRRSRQSRGRARENYTTDAARTELAS
jgi:hypothetical protein